MKKLSIISPCYQNELNFPATYEAIISDVVEKIKDVEFEIIFVNDGSYDKTLEKLLEIQKKDDRVKVVNLARNFGEFRAIVAGMEVACGDVCCVMSADLQDPPSLIPKMYEEYLNGNKVVIAARKARKESKLKNFLANTYYAILRFLVLKSYPKQGFDFFMIDKSVKDILVNMQEKNSTIYVQLIWLGFKPKVIEYVRQNREKGKSMWSYGKRINLFIDTFIVFSHKPIRIISFFGLIMSFLGFIMACFFVYEKVFLNASPSGWTTIIVVLLIIGGFQMIMLGIVGEYLWRNLDETRKRPLYVIDEIYEKR